METIIVSLCYSEEVVQLENEFKRLLRICQIKTLPDVLNLEKDCISQNDPVNRLSATLVDLTSG